MGIKDDEMPEWKKATYGGKGGSFGKKSNLSLVEQRESLPIFKLRPTLIEVDL